MTWLLSILAAWLLMNLLFVLAMWHAKPGRNRPSDEEVDAVMGEWFATQLKAGRYPEIKVIKKESE